MKIMHIVGNRPQFIKLAPVSRELRRRGLRQIIVHTGQHYDENMSDIFFEELDIPRPQVNLGTGSGSHAQITARILEKVEKVLITEKPDGVVVYGDTDSTLAAVIAASKLNVPLFHVEAGPWSYSRINPEEKNRVVADHLSDYLFAPDKASVENLRKEGIASERIIFSGDVMYDEFLYLVSQIDTVSSEKSSKEFILMTWHRAENTCSIERMKKMLSFICKLDYKIIFPIHPRTRKRLTEYDLMDNLCKIKNLMLIEPVGYKEMVTLLHRCKLVVSDSGGGIERGLVCRERMFFSIKYRVLARTG